MFPTLSVTVIGLLVGAVGLFGSRRGGWQRLVGGVLGAWSGFALGALIGVALDVVLTTGVWVAIVGHAMALAGAVVLVRKLPATSDVH